MAIYRRSVQYERIREEEIEAWARFPTSILSDVMNRGHAMTAAIKPVRSGTRLCGQARTVCAMVADSSVVHAAVSVAESGDVLVMDVGGYLDRACWGGIATRTAMKRGVRGVVMNGASRDVAEIADLGFALYCAGAVPAGPHKGHGGTIDDAVAIGGVVVHPGDIVVGDDDGVAVVPLRDAANVQLAAEALMAKEAQWLELVEKGGTMAETLGIRIEVID